MRILHAESSHELGGQELRTLQEATGMRERGHEVVLALQPHSALRECAERHGVPVAPIFMAPLRFGVLIRQFLTLIARYRIDLVNTHGSIESWTAAMAGRLSRRRPVIVRTRHKSTPVLPTLRHQWLYGRLPHAIVTTGEHVRTSLIQGLGLSEGRVVSIPTGVDLLRFHPKDPDGDLRRAWKVAPGENLIGTIAFLRSYKGVQYFLEAARLVRAEHPNTRFLVVGVGPEEHLLRKRAEGLNLTSWLSWGGFRHDIPEILSALDIVVIPSVEGEGVPQVLTQALAMERPVVATQVGGIPELVHDGVTGVLVPPRDADRLARGIMGLLADDRMRKQLGRAGRRVVEEAYSIHHMLDRTEKLYSDLLAGRDPSPRTPLSTWRKKSERPVSL